jgi:hypothetical protein
VGSAGRGGWRCGSPAASGKFELKRLCADKRVSM